MRPPLLISSLTNDSPHEAKSKSKLVDQIRYACSDWWWYRGGGGFTDRGGRERKAAAEEKKPPEEVLA